jgi:hypothetical protein
MPSCVNEVVRKYLLEHADVVGLTRRRACAADGNRDRVGTRHGSSYIESSAHITSISGTDNNRHSHNGAGCRCCPCVAAI